MPLLANLSEAVVKQLVQVGVPPGSTTTVMCSKLEGLKKKFVTDLASEEESFAKQRSYYVTKVCAGMGCESDEAQRMRYQAEWDSVQSRHAEEVKRLQDLLDQVEEVIEEPPFRRCPEFEEYLESKRRFKQGKDLLDAQQASLSVAGA